MRFSPGCNACPCTGAGACGCLGCLEAYYLPPGGVSGGLSFCNLIATLSYVVSVDTCVELASGYPLRSAYSAGGPQCVWKTGVIGAAPCVTSTGGITDGDAPLGSTSNFYCFADPLAGFAGNLHLTLGVSPGETTLCGIFGGRPAGIYLDVLHTDAFGAVQIQGTFGPVQFVDITCAPLEIIFPAGSWSALPGLPVEIPIDAAASAIVVEMP